VGHLSTEFGGTKEEEGNYKRGQTGGLEIIIILILVAVLL